MYIWGPNSWILFFQEFLIPVLHQFETVYVFFSVVGYIQYTLRELLITRVPRVTANRRPRQFHSLVGFSRARKHTPQASCSMIIYCIGRRVAWEKLDQYHNSCARTAQKFARVHYYRYYCGHRCSGFVGVRCDAFGAGREKNHQRRKGCRRMEYTYK